MSAWIYELSDHKSPMFGYRKLGIRGEKFKRKSRRGYQESLRVKDRTKRERSSSKVQRYPIPRTPFCSILRAGAALFRVEIG
jgi:hypothetical protein